VYSVAVTAAASCDVDGDWLSMMTMMMMMMMMTMLLLVVIDAVYVVMMGVLVVIVCGWQLNIQRAVERRTPQDIQSLHTPFDHTKFNFTRVKPDEILFELSNCWAGNNRQTSDDAEFVVSFYLLIVARALTALTLVEGRLDRKNQQSTEGKHPISYCTLNVIYIFVWIA